MGTKNTWDALTDAWLSELWAPVREYRPLPMGERAAALVRREGLAVFWGDEWNPEIHTDTHNQ